jgi:glycosyltransferase involved in cell wall biosynthesis
MFIGDGPMRGELEARVQHLGLQDTVTFTGHIDDVARLLGPADVMVRPSQTEGQSLAILEAMASEAAVIASDIPPNRELLGDNERGLLVAPGDQDGLSAALGSLIGDGGRRVRLARAARDLAIRHTWDRCAESTGRVLVAAARREEVL